MDDEAKTPADRLERALREHEARKKATAERVAQQAPELERLKALQTQLEALPQNERRAVSDAAGMRHVSAAPKPIEPLRGGGYAPRPSPKAIRWPAWLVLPHVELWQAVALSLGVNPVDDLRNEVSRTPYRLSPLPAEFFERLTLCQQAVWMAGPIKPQGTLYEGMARDWRCRVLLAEVAAFLVLAGYEVPEEFEGVAAVRVEPGPTIAPAAAKSAPVAHDQAPPLEDWKMRVQAEAAAHWQHLRKLHCNPTKHGILPHLAKWCRENNIRTAGPSSIHPSEGYLKNVLVKWEPPR